MCSIASDWPWAIVVCRVDAPRIAGARVVGVQDAVEHRVAQVDVARSHVDLGPEHPRAVGELAAPACARNSSRFSSTLAVAVGAVGARLGERAAILPDLFGRQIVDIGLAVLDQLFGPFVEPLEVVRGEEEVRSPVEAQPSDILLDGFDVLHLLLDRVGVVEAEVAAPPNSAAIPKLRQMALAWPMWR